MEFYGDDSVRGAAPGQALESGRQAVGLTLESGGCYTYECSLLRRFQQRVAAALQQAVLLPGVSHEDQSFALQLNWLDGLSA